MKAACMVPPPSHRSTGAALVLVLWLVAALSLTVLTGAHGMRQQTQHAGLALERLRAEALLDGALQLAAQRLVAEKDQPGRYRREKLTLENREVWVEITPSTGLIDINVASEGLLQAFFQRVAGMSSGESTLIASRIRDFIDPDDVPGGVGGAEAPQYRAAGWPTKPRNSALEDPSEIRAVLGVTQELYEIIAPYLSRNGQQRLDVQAAPPALIDALSGQKGLGAQLHRTPPGAPLGALLPETASDYFLAAASGNGQEVRMRASVRWNGERWWSREAWIDPRERPETLAPWTVLSLEPTRRINLPDEDSNP